MAGTRMAGRRRPDRPGASADRQLIYGWHSALAALQNPERRIRRVVATRNVLAKLEELGIPHLPPEPSEARDLDGLTGADAVHQGIALLCDPLPERELDEFADARLLVVLDQVTDPHNVGAILRSAAAFGAEALVMTERHGPGDSAVMAKAASGGLEYVPLVRVKNLARTMTELGELGFLRLGLDSEHADPIEAVPADIQRAVVLGAEGRGLRRLTRDHCDQLVRIDMPGPIKSLNVSNAAALALFALTRTR